MSKGLTGRVRGLVSDVEPCVVASVKLLTVNAAGCVLAFIRGMLFPTRLTEGTVGATILVVIKNLAFPTTLYVGVRAKMAMLETDQETAVRDDKAR